MSKIAWMLVLATACGGGNKAKDDAPGAGSDAACTGGQPAVPVQACSPIAGSTVSVRKIGQVSGGAMVATGTEADSETPPPPKKAAERNGARGGRPFEPSLQH